MKHCIICNRCYEGFDHHCYWINKCVAKRNYNLFIFFLFETTFYLEITLAINILGLMKINSINSFDIEDFCNKFNYFNSNAFMDCCNFLYKDKFLFHLILNILLICIIFSFLIPETLLLIIHINVCCFNYR